MIALQEIPVGRYHRRVIEIARDPHSRLARTQHKSAHDTVYVLRLASGDYPIRVKTLSVMETDR
jgi:hypothetical protein